MSTNIFINSTLKNNTFIFNQIDYKEDIVKQDFSITENSTGLSKISNLEFHRKVNITNRSLQVIEDISSTFEKNKNLDASVSKPVLLKSWSGEGKTTIAVEFAYLQGKNFISSFWIDANISIREQYVDIAQNKLGLTIPVDIEDKERIKFQINAVKDYINSHNSLMIFDNVNSLDDIDNFLPTSGKAKTIVITTNFNIKHIDKFNEINIPKLEKEDALIILLNGIDTNKANKEIALNICEIFGYSPFALELANSYLSEYPSLDIEFFYQDIRDNTIKWEGMNRNNNFNFIHSTPSIRLLIEKKIDKLDIENEIDNHSKSLLSLIGAMEFVSYDFKYDEIKKCLGIKTEDKLNLLKFE